MPLHGRFQMRSVQVKVHSCARQIRVSQQVLYGYEVTALLQQQGCERMPQRVQTDAITENARFLRHLLENETESVVTEWLPGEAREYIIMMHVGPELQPIRERAEQCGPYDRLDHRRGRISNVYL